MDTIEFLWDMLVLLATTAVLVALPVAMLHLLRARQGLQLRLALAAWAWALLLWATTAEKYSALRGGIGSFTLGLLQLIADAIFVALIVQVMRSVWRWPPASQWERRLFKRVP